MQQQSRAATAGEGHALAVTWLPSRRLRSVSDQSTWDLWYRDRFYISSCQCHATNCHTHSFITCSLLYHQWLLMTYVFVRFGVHKWYCWGFRCGVQCCFTGLMVFMLQRNVVTSSSRAKSRNCDCLTQQVKALLSFKVPQNGNTASHPRRQL